MAARTAISAPAAPWTPASPCVRTALVKNETMDIQAGAGVIADSDSVGAPGVPERPPSYRSRVAPVAIAILNAELGILIISCVSMVAMASGVKLDLSMRIARHSDLAEVAV